MEPKYILTTILTILFIFTLMAVANSQERNYQINYCYPLEQTLNDLKSQDYRLIVGYSTYYMILGKYSHNEVSDGGVLYGIYSPYYFTKIQPPNLCFMGEENSIKAKVPIYDDYVGEPL